MKEKNKSGMTVLQYSQAETMFKTKAEHGETSTVAKFRNKFGIRFSAFTLAEVLITLGVIGVVAALTLPSLITNYREKQRVTQLKKAYSTLQQAFVRAQEAHGEVQYWDLANTSTGEVDENGKEILDHSGNERILAYLSEFLDAPKSEDDLTITNYTLTGDLLNKDTVYSKSRYLKLKDGTMIVMGWARDNCADILVYLNYDACKKRGCRLGVDSFYFLLQPKVGISPKGLPEKSPDGTFEQWCNLGVKNNKYNGRSCTAWVVYKENMDYLHCNDLSWNGKSKCTK